MRRGSTASSAIALNKVSFLQPFGFRSAWLFGSIQGGSSWQAPIELFALDRSCIGLADYRAYFSKDDSQPNSAASDAAVSCRSNGGLIGIVAWIIWPDGRRSPAWIVEDDDAGASR